MKIVKFAEYGGTMSWLILTAKRKQKVATALFLY